MQPGLGGRPGGPLPRQPVPHTEPHRRHNQLQPAVATVPWAWRHRPRFPGGHGRHHWAGLGEQGGTEAPGAGGGSSSGSPDGEDHEVVVRLYCKLEREVEQGQCALLFNSLASLTLAFMHQLLKDFTAFRHFVIIAHCTCFTCFVIKALIFGRSLPGNLT